MVSLGRLRAPAFFRRRNSEPIPMRKSHSSDQSTDDSLSSGDNDADRPLAVHLIGITDRDRDVDYSFEYRPVNRLPRLRRTSTDGSSSGSIEISDSVRELIQKRTSRSCFTRRSSATQSRGVIFLDEALGLTPRHIVTETHYRPYTSIEEKKTLHYCSKDFILFEREYLYEKVEAEIKAIERQKKKEQDGDVSLEDEDSVEDKEAMDLEQVQRLVQKVRTRLNLEHA